MLKRVDTSSAKVKEMLEEIMSEVTKEAQTALKQMSHDVRETRDFKRSVKSSSSKEPVEATDFMKKE
jgi:ribosomal protein L22